MPKTTKKKSQKVVTEQYLDERLKQFATKDDIKASEKRIINSVGQKFVTNESMKEALKSSEKRIINAVKTMMEIRDEELQGAHQDELDTVAGEKIASTPWKSIPRRLQTVETEVTKIKDHLALS